MPHKKATLMDIANVTGFSAMTVSKALNNKKGISSKTRAQIVKVAEQMKYTPNLIARSLRSDATATIGVVLAATNEMVSFKLLGGISAAADLQNYSLLLASVGRNAEKEEKAIQMLVSKRIDGLMLVAPTRLARAEIEAVKAYGIPLMMLMRRSMEGEADCVVNDNVKGAYSLVKHLVETGSRRFLFLRIAQPSQAGDERMDGWRRAIEESDVQIDGCIVEFCQPEIEPAYEAVRRIVASNLKFDALVCGCDLMAVGAIQALREAGISVPHQVRVTGYDDLEIANHLATPLTTLRPPFWDMGKLGFEILFNRIKENNTAGPFRSTLMDGTVVLRASTER